MSFPPSARSVGRLAVCGACIARERRHAESLPQIAGSNLFVDAVRDLLDPRLRGSGGAGLGSGGMSARAIEGARRTLQKAARSTRSATRQSQPTGQKRANMSARRLWRGCAMVSGLGLERMLIMRDYAIQPSPRLSRHGYSVTRKTMQTGTQASPAGNHSRTTLLGPESRPLAPPTPTQLLIRQAITVRAEGAARHFACTTATLTAGMAGRRRRRPPPHAALRDQVRAPVQGGAGCSGCRMQN